MTQFELLEKINEYRKEYLELFTYIPKGQDTRRIHKYNVSFDKKQMGDATDTDIQRHIEFIHLQIANLYQENVHGISILSRLTIKNLLKDIEKNCTEEYLNVLAADKYDYEEVNKLRNSEFNF